MSNIKSISKLSFQDGKSAEFLSGTNDNDTGVHFTRRAPGNINVSILQDVSDPDVVFLVSEWDSQESYIQYLQTRSEQGFMEFLSTLLIKETEIHILKDVSPE